MKKHDSYLKYRLTTMVLKSAEHFPDDLTLFPKFATVMITKETVENPKTIILDLVSTCFFTCEFQLKAIIALF